MRRPELWFRAAAVVMLLFAAGHTVGFLTFRPPTEAARAVWDAMHQVHFSDGSASFSYAGFYTGFGLSATAFQLFLAWLCWRLATMTRRGLREASTIAWGMGVLQLAGAGLSLRYFSYLPAIFSLGSASLLFLGGWATRQTEAPRLAAGGQGAQATAHPTGTQG